MQRRGSIEDKLRSKFQLPGDDEAKPTRHKQVCHSIPSSVTVSEVETGEAQEEVQTLWEPVVRTRVLHQPIDKITRTDVPIEEEQAEYEGEIVSTPPIQRPRGYTQRALEECHATRRQ
ncbi:hypothetical protein P9112_002485 [Eukaryota sp. TZLM1-RC]